jgi:nitroreductase
MIRDLILKNRSYRRFDESGRITAGELRDWVDLARLSASARNAQPLKYLLVNGKDECDRLFPMLSWAGYLKDWGGPVPGERPSAYIVMLLDREIAADCLCDDGIAAQSILLGATEAGFGGCIVASVNRKALQQAFHIGERFHIIQVLALGRPAETVVLEPMENGDPRYWRDEHSIHHVPKRPLSELILAVI